IKKCKKSISIISQWLEVFKKDFNLVDNSPSSSENFPGFIENRHDQSVFSILCKINNVKTISSSEVWQNNWDNLKSYPIHGKRDKKLNILNKIMQKRNYRKYFISKI